MPVVRKKLNLDTIKDSLELFGISVTEKTENDDKTVMLGYNQEGNLEEIDSTLILNFETFEDNELQNNNQEIIKYHVCIENDIYNNRISSAKISTSCNNLYNQTPTYYLNLKFQNPAA